MQTINQLIEIMLDKQSQLCSTDEIYKLDIEEIGGEIKINWDFSGSKAYQVYKTEGCEGKVGEHLEDADLLIEIYNEKHSREFLINEEVTQIHLMPGTIALKRGFHEFGYFTDSCAEGIDGKMHREAIPVLRINFREGYDFSYLYATRIPLFRPAMHEFLEPELNDPNDYGSYIPINESLHGKELAKRVFHHFIDKTENIFRLPYCPCRKAYGSKHRVDIGCIHMGDDTLKMPHAEDRGVYIGRQEAKEVLDMAMDDGLIPLLGRASGEANGFGILDEGRFLSTCYCGSDACFNSTVCRKTSHGSKDLFKRVAGLSLVVDREKCIACGKCMKTCPYTGMKWVDGKPEIVEKCLGCGQCEAVCPVGAISFIAEYDLDTMVQKTIESLEKVVDVSPKK